MVPGPTPGPTPRPPRVVLQLTTSCLPPPPLPLATSALPLLQGSGQGHKPRTAETSRAREAWGPAPVPMRARHQCPVGERKSVPSQARAPLPEPSRPTRAPSSPQPWTTDTTTMSAHWCRLVE